MINIKEEEEITEAVVVISKGGYAFWRYESVSRASLKEISDELKISYILAEVLYKRNLRTSADIDKFLKSPLSELRDPFDILNMDKAVERIYQAIKGGERICIYGDYDVDGVTSTSILYMFLQEVGADVVYYIPNRLEEGYGLNTSAIDEIATRDAKLIITVDCGISAIDEVAYSKSIGIDIIITDHHQQSENLPDAATAIINPMITGDKYPFKGLAGVGVTFKVIMALRTYLRRQSVYTLENQPNIKKYLDIVCLGTIADIVPLIDENRILVRHGLQMINEAKNRKGIKELRNIADLYKGRVKLSDISFGLVPRLNAVGRMGSSNKSLLILLTEDDEEAKSLAIELDNENSERRAVERDIIKEAFEIIDSNPAYKDRKSIVVCSENWHIGVIGIVASRIVERYYKPTIVLSLDGDTAKGSARSIPAFHLYDSLSEINHLLTSFGGHKYAAGLKLMKDNIDTLTTKFEEIASKDLTEENMLPEYVIDTILEPSDISVKMIEEIMLLEPFGVGNKEPVFVMYDITLTTDTKYVGKDLNHLRAVFNKNTDSIACIGFNMLKYKDLLFAGKKYDIAFTLSLNEYKGSVKPQLNLKDIRLATS